MSKVSWSLQHFILNISFRVSFQIKVRFRFMVRFGIKVRVKNRLELYLGLRWNSLYEYSVERKGREGKRYLRVYIQIRFRHACHETRDRQSRSLVSGQEEGWGEVKVLLKFWIQLRSMSGLLKKTQNKICLLKSKFEVICEQFWRAVKRMSVRLFIKKNSNNKFWTLFRKILKSD